jgi:PilZ domain-containing protein
MSDVSSGFPKKDRRKFERVKSNEAVIIKLHNTEYQGVIKNKSERGFYVEIDKDLFEGLKINLEYYSETAQKEINFTGRVLRKDKSGIGVEIRYEF